MYQGDSANPCPVSAPKSTAFCHSITPQAGSTVLPIRNTCLKGTFLHRSASSFTANTGANTVRKLGLMPVHKANSPARTSHCLPVRRSL